MEPNCGDGWVSVTHSVAIWRSKRRGGSHLYRLIQQHAARYVGGGLALSETPRTSPSPFGGQGMNLAMQDAAALADHAAPVLREGASDATLAAALAAYEQQRRPINTHALRAANGGAWLTAPGRVRYAFARAVLAALSAAPALRERIRARFGGA